MNLTTPTALARKIGISKQAVFDSIENGRIPHVLKGKMKKIDLDDDMVKLYIKDESRQRESAKKNESEKQTKKAAKKKTTSKKQSSKTTKKSKKSEFEEILPVEIRKRQMIADMKKKELQAAHLEKKLIPLDFIENYLFRYLEKLNSNIERHASVYVTEVGNKILEAGEILPVHIEAFTSNALKTIHDTKKSIMKEIKKYEPKL